jgi:hypothetical protein
VTQLELENSLKTTGFPVTYRQFKVDKKNPPPEPPYIVYFRSDDTNISSDVKVHGKFRNYQIELYFVKKDSEIEQQIETVLENIDTGYFTSETWIESEELYQVVYQIKVIERS